METKAAILEKIIKYERVHHIKDMNDLKIRLGEDRRFFSYFHPTSMTSNYICAGCINKRLRQIITELLKPTTAGDKKNDTATFYSNSNCQEGLSRVTLGNFLIKRVVYEIQEELPH